MVVCRGSPHQITPMKKTDDSTPSAALNHEHPLTGEQISRFRRDGYIKLKNVLPPETLRHYGAEITRQVKLLNTETRPMEQRDTYTKAFLQIMNIWRKSEMVKEFVFNRCLARLATELLGTRGVRRDKAKAKTT